MIWKRILKVAGGVLGLAVLALAGYVTITAHRFDVSMEKVYDVPVPPIDATSNPEAIERGRHLAESVGGCAGSDCHGSDLGGATVPIDAGPLGVFRGPNLTSAGVGATYTDGELARVILHGIKRDGRSVRMMPAHEINWLPDEDVAAILSYVRSVPPVERPNGETRIGLLGKVLDRNEMAVIDVARRIDHEHRVTAPQPEPTALYGAFLAQGCRGCHGEHMSGGKIPGAPASFAIPANLTPDATGLRDWTFETFEHLLATRERPDGRKLDPFMPVESLAEMNETERRALWEYLRSLPPRPYGGR